uniref:Uncharacterized protein n=1 Tax=Parascaris univalens TaxID=6257 RepID=A0A914ZNV7_PARUN
MQHAVVDSTGRWRVASGGRRRWSLISRSGGIISSDSDHNCFTREGLSSLWNFPCSLAPYVRPIDGSHGLFMSESEPRTALAVWFHFTYDLLRLLTFATCATESGYSLSSFYR